MPMLRLETGPNTATHLLRRSFCPKCVALIVGIRSAIGREANGFCLPLELRERAIAGVASFQG